MLSAAITVMLVVLLAFSEARPSFHLDPRPNFGSESSYIVGGEAADISEFPWQLSQQFWIGRWQHNCGASLLSPRCALTAAHCFANLPARIMRVVARVSNLSSEHRIITKVASYKLHEQYLRRNVTNSDDIAIMTLATPIYANGVTIQYATLPDNNDDLFVGREGIIIGWGRTGPSFSMSRILQKASIGVLSTADCNTKLKGKGSADDSQICLYDTENRRGCCNGDSGGSFNLNGLVAGITSWVVMGDGNCLQSYPSVYVRTSYYLDWIKANTP